MKEITYALLDVSAPVAVREIPRTERQKIVRRCPPTAPQPPPAAKK